MLPPRSSEACSDERRRVVRGTGTGARSDEARRLIEESTRALVGLVTVSAMELRMLDGPRHLLFDEPVAAAWRTLDDGARAAATSVTADGLVNRGLLLDAGTHDTYAVKPGLGLVLAARPGPPSLCSRRSRAPRRGR